MPFVQIHPMRGTLSLHSATPAVLTLPPAANNPLCGGSGNQTNTCNIGTKNGTDACNMMAVVMLVSHGKDGYGAFVPDSVAIVPTPSGAAAAEIENADNNEQFVLIPYSDSEQVGQRFDDFLLPITASDLLSPLERHGVQLSATAVTRKNVDGFFAQLTDDMIVNPGAPAIYSPLPNDGWGTPVIALAPTGRYCDLSGKLVTVTSKGVDGYQGVNADISKCVIPSQNDDLAFSQVMPAVACP